MEGIGLTYDIFILLTTFVDHPDYAVLSFVVAFSNFMTFFDDACNVRAICLMESILRSPSRQPGQSMQPLYTFVNACLFCFRTGLREYSQPALQSLTQEYLSSIPRDRGIEAPTVEGLRMMLLEIHRLGEDMRRKNPGRAMEGGGQHTNPRRSKRARANAQ